MALIDSITKLIKQQNTVVTISNDKGTKGTTPGAYVVKESTNQAMSGVEVISNRTVYLPADIKFAPEPNDIVAFGKIKTRVIDVREYTLQGAVVAYVLVVQ